jgi:hypothetical protein
MSFKITRLMVAGRYTSSPEETEVYVPFSIMGYWIWAVITISAPASMAALKGTSSVVFSWS